MAVPAGITMTFEASGKPNSIVRPLIMAPSAASRLIPVQAWACVVAKVKAAVSAAMAVLRNIGKVSWKESGADSFRRTVKGASLARQPKERQGRGEALANRR